MVIRISSSIRLVDCTGAGQEILFASWFGEARTKFCTPYALYNLAT
jgi:hypothetical protein